MVVRRPSGRCHIDGAERSWDVRRVTFNGFERSVRMVVAEPSSLNRVRYSTSLEGFGRATWKRLDRSIRSVERGEASPKIYLCASLACTYQPRKLQSQFLKT